LHTLICLCAPQGSSNASVASQVTMPRLALHNGRVGRINTRHDISSQSSLTVSMTVFTFNLRIERLVNQSDRSMFDLLARYTERLLEFKLRAEAAWN
jgi:hypothetical protein